MSDSERIDLNNVSLSTLTQGFLRFLKKACRWALPRAVQIEDENMPAQGQLSNGTS